MDTYVAPVLVFSFLRGRLRTRIPQMKEVMTDRFSFLRGRLRTSTTKTNTHPPTRFHSFEVGFGLAGSADRQGHGSAFSFLRGRLRTRDRWPGKPAPPLFSFLRGRLRTRRARPTALKGTCFHSFEVGFGRGCVSSGIFR